MSIVDQDLAVKRLEERRARVTDERHNAMLKTVADHMRAEAAADVDGLLATLVEAPDYHLWQDGRDYGPKGVDGVLDYYSELVAAKRQILEFDITRIVVDDDTIVTEGWIRAINLGAVARARGFVVDDPDASYLVTQRVVIFWPFDADGRMLGEDGYATFDAHGARRLEADELPEVYTRLFATV